MIIEIIYSKLFISNNINIKKIIEIKEIIY